MEEEGEREKCHIIHIQQMVLSFETEKILTPGVVNRFNTNYVINPILGVIGNFIPNAILNARPALTVSV